MLFWCRCLQTVIFILVFPSLERDGKGWKEKSMKGEGKGRQRVGKRKKKGKVGKDVICGIMSFQSSSLGIKLEKYLENIQMKQYTPV